MHQIFFDKTHLKKGRYFNLIDDVTGQAGKYELTEWIARGGNATVFGAINSNTGDEIALKFLMNLSPVSRTRFRREIDLLSQLSSDHIIKYFDTGEAQVVDKKSENLLSIPFLVLELADKNLQDVMAEKKFKISYEEYAGQFRGLTAALAKLHSVAIHRDIKPENILVSGDRWVLSDYGLCSFVSEDTQEFSENAVNLGPKFWHSPEGNSRRLGCGDEITKKSDVYQLAAVFWYVATGRHPSGILTKSDWTGPEKLFELIYSCLYHDCSKRPSCGSELFQKLDSCLQS